MTPDIIFAIVVSISCGAAAFFFLWMWFRSKEKVEIAKSDIGKFHNNIFLDAWAQHKDKVYMIFFVLSVIGVFAAISIPFIIV